EKDAILKARGFHYDEKMRKEMENMESWSRYIFNSMKPMMLEDAKKEVKEQVEKEVRDEVTKEVRDEGYKEGAKALMKVYHFLAKGMSNTDILKALPEVSIEFVVEARDSYEEVLSLEAQQK
ncbi:MAG: hypothetical protein PUF83_11220, partial [Intestinibaculum porci]|uniref:hypothetical protein n=1 Tax=Intestinibaculum porci TaxID=2487118 RepID=UPI002409F5C3